MNDILSINFASFYEYLTSIQYWVVLTFPVVSAKNMPEFSRIYAVQVWKKNRQMDGKTDKYRSWVPTDLKIEERHKKSQEWIFIDDSIR